MDETPINTNTAPAPEAPAAAPIAPAPAPEKKSHTGLIIGIIVAVLLIVAGAVVCVILLTSNKDGEGNNGGNTTSSNQTPTNQTPPEEKGTSLISCVAEGDGWEYGNYLTLDTKKQQITKMKYELKTDDDFDGENLTENERNTIAGAVMLIPMFGLKDDPGIKLNIVSEGDENGAGANMSAELTRSKLEDEDLISQFEEVDGYDAEEIIEMIESNNLEDVKMYCEVE